MADASQRSLQGRLIRHGDCADIGVHACGPHCQFVANRARRPSARFRAAAWLGDPAA